MADPGMATAVVRDGLVSMLDQRGQSVQIPLDQIEGAYAQGLTLEDPAALDRREKVEKHGGLAGEALTAVEGAASGLTFGVSDQALVAALGDEYREGAQARREINPNAAMAGQVVGALAPAVFSGGSSLAARAALAPGRLVAGVGRAVEGAAGRSLAGRIAGGAASGAIEGAAYSAGQANADAALGGTELTAEKLLSAAGEGALWGAAGGAALSGGSAAVGKAGDYAVKKMLGEGTTLRQALGDYAAGKAVQAVSDAPLPVSAERAKGLGERLLREGVPLHDPAAASAAIKALASKADETAARVAKIADDAGIKPDVSAVLKAADNAAAKLRDTPTAEFQAAAKQVDSVLEPLRAKVARKPGSDFYAPLPAATMQDLLEVRKALAAPGKGPAEEALKAVRASLDEALETSLQKVDESQGLHAAAAQGDTIASELLSSQRNAKDAFLQATRDADDWGVLSRAADQKISEGMKERLATVGQSTLLGLVTGLATGDVSAGMATAVLGKGLQAAGKAYALQRGMGGLMRIADRVARVDAQLDASAAAIVTGKAARPPTTGQVGGLAGGFYARLKEQLSDPEQSRIQAIHEQWGADHPEVALAMQERLQGDAEYLRKRLPPSATPAGSALQPDKALKEQTSTLDLRRLKATADALNDPASVADALAAGYYDPDAVAALKTRRPKMYEELRTRVMSEAASSDTYISYSRRAVISLAFDFPADWSFEPANLTKIQQTAQPQPDQGEGSPGPSQRANISGATAEKYALPSNPIGS